MDGSVEQQVEVAAFAPLLFVTGNMGKIMKQIPIVVIAVLLISLVEALFILPAHLASDRSPVLVRIGRLVTFPFMPLIRRLRGFQSWAQDRLQRLVDGPYRATLEFTLRWRYATVAGAVAYLSFGTPALGFGC